MSGDFTVFGWSFLLAVLTCSLAFAVCYYIEDINKRAADAKKLKSEKKLEKYNTFEELSEETKRYLI